MFPGDIVQLAQYVHVNDCRNKEATEVLAAALYAFGLYNMAQHYHHSSYHVFCADSCGLTRFLAGTEDITYAFGYYNTPDSTARGITLDLQNIRGAL